MLLLLGLLKVLKKREVRRLQDGVSKKVISGRGLELMHGLKGYSEDEKAAQLQGLVQTMQNLLLFEKMLS